MNDQLWDIDTIVREVLQRLEQQTGAARAESECACATVVPAERAGGTWRVDDRVVSLATLDGRLHNVQRLVIPRAAVVTPSARDLLRQRNIAVERMAEAAPAVNGTPNCVALVAAADVDPRGLEPLIAAPVARADGVTTAVQQLVRSLREEGRIGVLFTERTALAVCLANRQRGVRAAAGSCPEAVRDALNSLAVNLLVIDPRGRSLDDLAGTVSEFLRAAHARTSDAF
jgi:hypothetical protein